MDSRYRIVLDFKSCTAQACHTSIILLHYSSFRFSAVTCEVPNFTNGILMPTNSTFTEGDVALLKCNDGFVLGGASSPALVCLENGQWDHYPACIGEWYLRGNGGLRIYTDMDGILYLFIDVPFFFLFHNAPSERMRYCSSFTS